MSFQSKRLFNEDINLIYDGKCNLCLHEVNFLKSRDKYKRIKFTDIESESYNADLPEVTCARLTLNENMVSDSNDMAII